MTSSTATVAFPEGSYILPLRWLTDEGRKELTSYLEQLSQWMTIIVVDGSPAPLFEAHSIALPAQVLHIHPQSCAGTNGKVAGVLTGVAMARTEFLILADDDVRYDQAGVERILTLLTDADVVRPQNHFLTFPWHARLDTARSLINRAFGADYPGTLGVRRSALIATGGYDGDVLFENLELLRTIKAAGGREIRANDLFIARTAPNVSHFFSQRVRQAYDDFAQPWRLVIELTLLPLITLTLYSAFLRRRPVPVLALTAAAWATAELGRRRNNGAQVFGITAALWGPAWLVERSLSVWIAVIFGLLGGVPYAGGKLSKAANTTKALRRKHQGKITAKHNEGTPS